MQAGVGRGFIDGLSVYGYALSNPQSYVDPDGRSVRMARTGGMVTLPPLSVFKICFATGECCRSMAILSSKAVLFRTASINTVLYSDEL